MHVVQCIVRRLYHPPQASKDRHSYFYAPLLA